MTVERATPRRLGARDYYRLAAPNDHQDRRDLALVHTRRYPMTALGYARSKAGLILGEVSAAGRARTLPSASGHDPQLIVWINSPLTGC